VVGALDWIGLDGMVWYGMVWYGCFICFYYMYIYMGMGMCMHILVYEQRQSVKHDHVLAISDSRVGSRVG